MSGSVPELVNEATAEVLEEAAAMLHSVVIESEIQVRNLAKREVDMRIAPFDTIIQTLSGPEVIVRGAFADTDPSKVLLMGLEHEVHLGIGQDGRVIPTRRPNGKALSIEERADGAYATFRVAKTAGGDEFLALAEDGVVGGVSVEMGRNARTRTETRNGRRTSVVEFADLRAVSPTYQPAYADARVLAVRSQEEDAPVAEDKAPANGATEDTPEPRVELATRSVADTEMANHFAKIFESSTSSIVDRLEKIEERTRSQFVVPGAPNVQPKVNRGEWMGTVLKMLSGDRIPDIQTRALADLITTDNAGVVPDAYVNDMIGIIDPSRPFLESTRKLDTPDAGMTLVVPRIVTRPTVGTQVTEKTQVTSTATAIDTVGYDAITKAGAGDISLQLLKRSSPSFLGLYLELLAEAYAIETEDEAVDVLLAQAAVVEGGTLDPENASFGSAWTNAFNSRLRPDTIWMSSAAVAAFIDAKASGTNAPLYSNLAGNITAGGGLAGTISGLRPVHVPALDNVTVDADSVTAGVQNAAVIVGPSRGFAWAEDGTYTLQVDVPARAGRDVALVGILWYAPMYPSAFTIYGLAA